jgi:hypothetical protein
MENIDDIAVAETSTELSDFDRRWAQGITGEEFIRRVRKHIESWPWKEKSSIRAK